MPSHISDVTGTGMIGSATKYAVVAATTTTIKNAPGRAVRVIVTVGTGGVTVADNATTVWTKAATAVGDIYLIDVPCTTSIVVTAAAATTAVVTYT